MRYSIFTFSSATTMGQKAIRTETVLLSADAPTRTLTINKGEEHFNMATTVVFTSPLTFMLVAKGKVSCIPFYTGDRDSCYELERAEKIVITVDDTELSAPVRLTVNIW